MTKIEPNLLPRDGDRALGCVHAPGAAGNHFFSVGSRAVFYDRKTGGILPAEQRPKWLVVCQACFQLHKGDSTQVAYKKAFVLDKDHPLDPETAN